MHPANEGFRPLGSGKKFIYILKKERQNFFNKKLCGSKKGCMFAAAKNGNVGSGGVLKKRCLLSVDWSVKKNFQKNFQKTLWDSKKGFIFAPA